MANIIKYLIIPLEKHLKKQEKFAEMQEEMRLDQLEADRNEKLERYVEDISVYDLRAMSDEAFDAMLATQNKLHDIRVKEEAVAKEEERRMDIIVGIEQKALDWGLDLKISATKRKELVSSEGFEEEIDTINKDLSNQIQEVKVENEKLKKEAKGS